MFSLFTFKSVLSALKKASDHPSFGDVTDCINETSVKSFLIAVLPLLYAPYMSGVFAVDMALTSFLSAFAYFVAAAGWSSLSFGSFSSTDEVSLKVEPQFNSRNYMAPNPYYTALVWFIARQNPTKQEGTFRMNVLDADLTIDELRDFDPAKNLAELEEIDLVAFAVVPGVDEWLEFERDGALWTVCFKDSEVQKGGKDEDSGSAIVPLPYVLIKQEGNTKIHALREFVLEVALLYDAFKKSDATRSRYKFITSNSCWSDVGGPSASLGLASVALDRAQSLLLNKDLRGFVDDQDFYARLGIPYRRGYLFSGPPGTGKSSLVNAISAELKRDIYYINIGDFASDSDLEMAFGQICKNAIIVLEDVDCQSKCVLDRRGKEEIAPSSQDLFDIELPSSSPSSSPVKKTGFNFSSISLSCLLNILDGHTLDPGQIIIFTSNHPEKLDPALIRPGRIDMHLKLDYATGYQIQKLFRMVRDIAGEGDTLDLTELPEKLLPPCDVMRIFILYREESVEFVEGKLRERAAEIAAGKEVGEAMDL